MIVFLSYLPIIIAGTYVAFAGILIISEDKRIALESKEKARAMEKEYAQQRNLL